MSNEPKIEIKVAVINGHPYVRWADVTDALEQIDESPRGREETDTWCSSEALEVAGSAVSTVEDASPNARGPFEVDDRTYCVDIPVVVHLQRLSEQRATADLNFCWYVDMGGGD